MGSESTDSDVDTQAADFESNGRYGWDIDKRSRNDYFTPFTTNRRRRHWKPWIDSFMGIRSKPYPASRFIPASILERQARGLELNQTLCRRCASINLATVLLLKGWNWKDSATSLGSFAEICSNWGCPLCRMFACLLANYHDDIDKTSQFRLVAFPTSAAYGENWTWEPAPSGIKETISLSIIDAKSFEHEYRVEQAEFIRMAGILAPVAKKGNYSSFEARILGPTTDIEVLKSWVNYCGFYHQETCTSGIDFPHRSTKVIDCSTRKMVPMDRDAPYLALSYVWGDVREQNNDENLNADPWGLSSNVPATIEDSMLLTRQLGYRYLWVDRYCISQIDTAEKSLQISQMDRDMPMLP